MDLSLSNVLLRGQKIKSTDSQDMTEGAEHSLTPNISYPKPLVPREFSNNRFCPNKISEHRILFKKLEKLEELYKF